MDPILIGLLTGTVVNKLRADAKYRKAGDISKKAVERVAEAELRCEQHQAEMYTAYESLCTRITGMTAFLSGPFASVFKPFEHADGSLLEDLFGDRSFVNLGYIRSVCDRWQFQQLPAHKKQTESAEFATSLLFGWTFEANRQLDTAKTQQSVARLIAEESDALCVVYDMQKEQYLRVHQTLGALNVALIKTAGEAKRVIERDIGWLLDGDGHVPADIPIEELKASFSEDGADCITNSINLAGATVAILEDPIFDHNVELTKKAAELLDKGEAAEKRIRLIQQKRG